MKIVFLGTNGWYDTKTGNTICTLIETNNEYLILDAGNGIYKIDKYIKKDKPIYLFLSHFHMEHITGLHMLTKFNFQQGMTIYGPKGTEEVLKYVINKPFTVPFDKLSTKVKLVDIESGKNPRPEFLEKKLLLKHSDRCLGYRFNLENKMVSYCTDTGSSDNLYKLAEKADLLITECALKSGEFNEKWGHLNPEVAANVAKKSKAKKLVLTHFDANAYKTLKERKQAEDSAKKIFKNTSSAYDRMNIEL
jgi:ribonuclease BN (tRNA processing enzyme)